MKYDKKNYGTKIILKSANVQNIQGKGLEIHYKRMSDRHQMSALKNNLSN